jgi:aminoglycoside N3'-acetyltransferase
LVKRITKETLRQNFAALNIAPGDIVLIRAGLKSVGRVTGDDFVDALLEAVGPDGTIVSLAFTSGSFIKLANPADAFTASTKSYAGALPAAMLAKPNAKRSRHPTCSYVAIGRYAEQITRGHGPQSGAYEPVRTIIELGGKCVLVGCVRDSPGFTTAHLAEIDLGQHRRVIMPWLSNTYYVDEEGVLKLFRRRDSGLCSQSFWKFYSYYVRAGILATANVGSAYSISAPAAECYKIEKAILAKSPKFNICGSPDCFFCNTQRWDRIHHIPLFLARRIMRHAGLINRSKV